ncbi:DUF5597 domain-containing protein [Phocaeicola plebeius]|uniref:GH35 family beta-galactosidase n=1 Tax=Phocaeicola plebeius TaxID=310297 RepID=UPI0026F35B7C|nr:DUF5597 domain-containing protein [Phocaeicola plebeius]
MNSNNINIMNLKRWILLALVTVVLFSCNSTTQKETPFLLENEYGAKQLIVDGKPFLMLSGELHNSTSSTEEYAAPIFSDLKAMNLNSVIASIAWQQFEPQEGVYDYSLVDMLIKNAEQNNLKLCLIWFASWKNGQSSYAPMWVKQDTDRFFRVKTKEGKNNEIISVFSQEARDADAKAFGKLMAYLKKKDVNKTVVMVQIENEVGIFQDIDYNEIALKKYSQNVPKELMDYMLSHKDKLQSRLYNSWEENGFKTAGSWQEVFGDDLYSKSYFMAWSYAKYMNYIAEIGKKEYNLPMYVNAWIIQFEGDYPGNYPNGGPVEDVLDVYKAAAPSIDILAPDAYNPDFKDVVNEYHRYDNPLVVPETTLNVGRAFYIFAQHDAICFSPFGIEDGASDVEFREGYQVLKQLMPIITKYQGSDRIAGVLLKKGESNAIIQMGKYGFNARYIDENLPSYGLVIQTSEDEFIVAGMNFAMNVSSNIDNKVGYVGEVWEGRFENGQWIGSRLLNGDESWHNEAIRVMGRKLLTNELDMSINVRDESKPYFYSANRNIMITIPGIYKVRLYTRD